MEEGWLTEEQLLTVAAEAGFTAPELTPRKIERWRKARLLPHPKLTSLGRGRGMRSEYPPGTVKQMLALCQHLRRYPHDLDAVRFALWYEDFPLPLEDVKQSIGQLLQPMQRYLATLAPDTSDPLAAAEHIAQQFQPKLGRSKWGRRLHHVGNEDDVNTILTAVFHLLLGGTPGFSAHAEEELGERSLAGLFIDALGLRRGQTDRIGEIDPWLPQDEADIGKQLEMLAGGQLLSFTGFQQILDELTAQQLAQGRRDLARFFLFKQAAKTMEALLGPNAFGYGLFRELPSDPSSLAMYLLFFIRLRPVLGTGLDEIGAALYNNKPIMQKMQALLKVLQHECPDIAEEILSQTQHLDLSDPQAFERQHEFFVAARAAHPDELDALFQRHPELRFSGEDA